MKKRLHYVLIIMLCCFFVCSCSASNPQEEILGAWVQNVDESYFVENGEKKGPLRSFMYSFTFREGGVADYGDLMPASYSFDGSKLTFQKPLDNLEVYTVTSFTKDKLEIELQTDVTYHYVYERP